MSDFYKFLIDVICILKKWFKYLDIEPMHETLRIERVNLAKLLRSKGDTILIYIKQIKNIRQLKSTE